MNKTHWSNRIVPLGASLALLLLAAACQAPGEQADSAMDAAAETVADAVARMAPIPPRANDEPRVSPNASVSQTIGTTVMTITYGRPAVKGRNVFGGLEPFGQVWRAGANEATVFSVTDDVTVNGEPLEAGAYALFAIPGEDEWTIIFNEQPEQWGAYNYDAAQDVLRVTATPEEGPPREWLTYAFRDLSENSATVVLHWSTTVVPFTVTVE